MTRRIKLALVLAVVAVCVSVSAGYAATTATPGVTASTVTIGGTFPLTGPAQLYGLIPKAENAYFQYVNAHGGVNGRKIVFDVQDDGYNPANTVPLTQKLVQQDHVFAIYGSLGTAPTLSTRDYLNKLHVPQVLVATGDSYWGSQYKKYPWTIGFQPDYPGESFIYGRFIRNKVPQAKIGVLIQDDASGANIQNDISTTYTYDVFNNPDSATGKLYKSILDQYDAGWNPLDGNNIYGLASAWTFVHALKNAGNPPTRAGLMKALTSLDTVNPFR